MKMIPFGRSGLNVPALALGCMRLNRLDAKEAETYVKTALDLGANFFDHADIYGGGACEEIFGKAIAGIPRDKLIIQTKCGIVPGKRYDFSAEHILNSVDESLKRLGVDYVDALLLHRPDALMDPVEVAEAFSRLKASGKVLNFGVSNQNSMQMQLLQKYMPMPICANQLQLSITNCTMISAGINVNTAKVLGLVVSNGLVALSGGLLAQFQGSADVGMGRGAIVIGLAAVIISEVTFGKIFQNFGLKMFAVSLGAVIYYFVLQIVLQLGLNTNDLKLVSALIVAVFLSVPYWKGKVAHKKGGAHHA